LASIPRIDFRALDNADLKRKAVRARVLENGYSAVSTPGI
jgi:hypothetical protein